MLNIRFENPEDYPIVKQVNDLAFGQDAEGEIVDLLRGSGIEYLSLVAENDGQLVGHIFFTPVEMAGHPEITGGMGLAPLAVMPGFQNQGIGSKLVREGIRILKEKGCPYIIVLGHDKFYPKFGFEPASKYNLKCQWEGVPEKFFMAQILKQEITGFIGGVVKYRDEFDAAM